MADKKNTILIFGNKEFNNSLMELKGYLKFNFKTLDELSDGKSLENYQGLIIHEDGLKDKNINDIIVNKNINKIIFHYTKKIEELSHIEKLLLPASIEQINKIVLNNMIKKVFKANSSLKINNYKLDKNLRRLTKNDLSLELTERDRAYRIIKEKTFTNKKEILSAIWRYSKDADTHTVETHIYRLRKRLKKYSRMNFL